jgi:SAM-dependent methyltransferase
MDRDVRARLYESRYLAEVGFEREMVLARQRLAIEVLATRRPRNVLEVGCGSDPLYEQAVALADRPERWVIVEPGDEFVEYARRAATETIELRVVHGFLEQRVAEAREACEGAPDLAFCLGVLHLVDDADGWLRALRSILGDGGMALLAVPNALSMHRRLARSMGLIADVHEFSERDHSLFHQRVYHLDSLVEVTEAAGFEIIETGGYLIKPFTHAQLEEMDELLSREMLDGLWQLGRELPELASEIFVLVRLAP